MSCKSRLLAAVFAAAALTLISGPAAAGTDAATQRWCDTHTHATGLDVIWVALGRMWDNCAPPPSPPPPQPPPPPPPPGKTYIVFFDFDRSNLTDVTSAVINQAVDVAKANGLVKVHVVGHTDTVGPDAYNMALSERRARAVAEGMVRVGLAPGGLTTEGKGYHDLLVPTGPGVREQQNRRAVIDLAQ